MDMTYIDAERYYDYQRERAEAEQDAYEAWCEDNDLDPDEDHSVEWEDYCDDMRESAAERRAEEREDMERFGEW